MQQEFRYLVFGCVSQGSGKNKSVFHPFNRIMHEAVILLRRIKNFLWEIVESPYREAFYGCNLIDKME